MPSAIRWAWWSHCTIMPARLQWTPLPDAEGASVAMAKAIYRRDAWRYGGTLYICSGRQLDGSGGRWNHDRPKMGKHKPAIVFDSITRQSWKQGERTVKELRALYAPDAAGTESDDQTYGDRVPDFTFRVHVLSLDTSGVRVGVWLDTDTDGGGELTEYAPYVGEQTYWRYRVYTTSQDVYTDTPVYDVLGEPEHFIDLPPGSYNLRVDNERYETATLTASFEVPSPAHIYTYPPAEQRTAYGKWSKIVEYTYSIGRDANNQDITKPFYAFERSITNYNPYAQGVYPVLNAGDTVLGVETRVHSSWYGKGVNEYSVYNGPIDNHEPVPQSWKLLMAGFYDPLIYGPAGVPLERHANMGSVQSFYTIRHDNGQVEIVATDAYTLNPRTSPKPYTEPDAKPEPQFRVIVENGELVVTARALPASELRLNLKKERATLRTHGGKFPALVEPIYGNGDLDLTFGMSKKGKPEFTLDFGSKGTGLKPIGLKFGKGK